MSEEPIGGLYRVRLTVEGMKHSIEKCLLDHDGALRATIESELSQAVANFDFKASVKDEIARSLPQVIRNSLSSAISDAFYRNPQFQGMIDGAVAKELQSILK